MRWLFLFDLYLVHLVWRWRGNAQPTQPFHITLYRNSKTWNEADKMCQSNDQQLVNVKSARKAKVLMDIVSMWRSDGILSRSTDLWCGLYDRNRPNKDYTWSDCTDQSGWTNWHRSYGEPNMVTTDHCVRMDEDNLDWRTINCGSRYYFLCEAVLDKCWFDSYGGSVLSSTVTNIGVLNHDDCRSQCLTYTEGEKECVALSIHNDGRCQLLVSTYLHVNSDPAMACSSSTVTDVKRCFAYSTTSQSSSYTNNNQRPQHTCPKSLTPTVVTQSVTTTTKPGCTYVPTTTTTATTTTSTPTPTTSTTGYTNTILRSLTTTTAPSTTSTSTSMTTTKTTTIHSIISTTTAPSTTKTTTIHSIISTTTGLSTTNTTTVRSSTSKTTAHTTTKTASVLSTTSSTTVRSSVPTINATPVPSTTPNTTTPTSTKTSRQIEPTKTTLVMSKTTALASTSDVSTPFTTSSTIATSTSWSATNVKYSNNPWSKMCACSLLGWVSQNVSIPDVQVFAVHVPSLSKTKRKLTSAYDNRRSALAIGASGLTILCGFVLFIMFLDCDRILHPQRAIHQYSKQNI